MVDRILAQKFAQLDAELRALLPRQDPNVGKVFERLQESYFWARHTLETEQIAKRQSEALLNPLPKG